MPRTGEDGRFRLPAPAARAQAGARRRRFSQRGAPLRPDERSHVGRAAPRLERRAGHRRRSAQGPASAADADAGARPFALLDLAGGTGDIAFRVVAAGGAGTRATVVDINADMLAVGRARAAERGLDDAISSSKAMPRALPFPGSQLRRRHPRLRHPQRAAHRGGARRSLSRAAARWALFVPRILHRRCARARCALRFLLLQRDPCARPRGRRRRATPIAISSNRSAASRARSVRRDDAGGRFCPRLVPAHDRRHRRAAFGLAVVIAGLAHLVRLGHAGFVFAREGVFALIDTTRLPLPARAAVRTARLIERPASSVAANRLATALTRLGPSYVKLGQFLATRPDVVGVAAGARPRDAAGQDGAVPASGGRSRGGGRFGQAAARPVRRVRPPGRGRLDRTGAPRRGRGRARPPAGRGEGAAAGRRTPLQGRSRRLHLRRPQRREHCPRKRGACAWSRWSTRSSARSRSRWICGSRRPRSRRWRRIPKRIPISACLPWTGTVPRATCSRWNGSRHAALRPRRGSKPRASISGASRAR